MTVRVRVRVGLWVGLRVGVRVGVRVRARVGVGRTPRLKARSGAGTICMRS